MKLEDTEQLIKKGESQTIEFKKSSANLKSAAETLCAFLNGKGGTVLIGVSDDKKIIGQYVTDQTLLEIGNTLRRFEPTANIEIQYVGAKSNNQIIVLTAHPDNRSIPYTFDGRAYEQKESSTNIMAQGKYQQLLLSRNLTPVSWESQLAAGILIDDLDHNEIINTLKDIVRKKRFDSMFDTNNVTDILTRFKLMEAGQITNAAVVLFCKEIPGNYLQCVIRMVRFRGIEKGNFIDSKHTFGNAFQLLSEAEAFINRNTSIASHFAKGELARKDEPEYPFEAIREALINSISHRDYASSGSSITVTIYDDRLEIANTGTLPQGITIADLKETHTSHPRNPRLINVFFRRGFIEAMGIGTQEIIKACATANMKEPDFFEQAGAFVVRLWSKHYKATTEHMDYLELTARQNKILKILKIHKKLSPREILDQLQEDITGRTLRNDLQVLKEKHYLYSEGKGPKTKWYTIENAEIIRK